MCINKEKIHAFIFGANNSNFSLVELKILVISTYLGA